MKAAVHLAVGASAGVAALILFRPVWRLRTELLFISVLGIWGLLPDFWWFFSDRRPLPSYHFPAAAAVWKQVHSSAVANLFWGHRFLDRHETGHAVLEAQLAVLGLTALSCIYVLLRTTRHHSVATE